MCVGVIVFYIKGKLLKRLSSRNRVVFIPLIGNCGNAATGQKKTLARQTRQGLLFSWLFCAIQPPQAGRALRGVAGGDQ
ncbi:hypothetical protein [Allofranklinella schreckenbergeri]|uniref:hypothetical protein n=1 Tax=Allofranklinella schreckenbergeri TaxID=1076744 RepID=UPI0011C344D2|nr:hypothetical protein [Allofranklinella schreckenbergeri]